MFSCFTTLNLFKSNFSKSIHALCSKTCESRDKVDAKKFDPGGKHAAVSKRTGSKTTTQNKSFFIISYSDDLKMLITVS